MRADCRAVLEKLASGDSLLEQYAATAALIRLTPASDDSRTLRERYRELCWLYEHAASDVDRLNIAQRFADGEVAALQALAIKNKRWPPPRNWLPRDTHQRDLILGIGAQASRAAK